jgi:hypothetical protein
MSPEEEKERGKWHRTTYLEYEIPKKLSKKLSKIIEKEIKKFEKQCKCGLCKFHKETR